jgi:hypothetical protein
MAFAFHERPRSRSSTYNPPSETRNYVAAGSTDEQMVRNWAHLFTNFAIYTDNMGALFRNDIRVEAVAADLFYVSVIYGQHDYARSKLNITFDTTGGTLTIRNSLETRGKYPVATAPDFKQLIGVNGETVEGTPVVIPALRLSCSVVHPHGIITINQIKHLARITAQVNSTRFLTFEPGEVLFLGCQGREGTEVDAEVAYHFAMQANRDGLFAPKLTIGDIANIVKRGHDYVWIRYEDGTETVGGSTYPTKIPLFCYVERVYEEVDLATALGFGA